MTTEIKITQNGKIVEMIASESNDIPKLLAYLMKLPEIQRRPLSEFFGNE